MRMVQLNLGLEKQYQEQKQLEEDRRMERLRADAETLEQGLPIRRMRAWLPVLTDRTAAVCDWFKPDLVLLDDEANVIHVFARGKQVK